MRTRTVIGVFGACLALTLSAIASGGRTQNGNGTWNGNGGMGGMGLQDSLSGTISSINEQDSTLVIQNGTTDTISIDTNTQIMSNGDTLELGDLQEDMNVTVEYQELDGKRTATHIRESQPNGKSMNGKPKMNGTKPKSKNGGYR